MVDEIVSYKLPPIYEKIGVVPGSDTGNGTHWMYKYFTSSETASTPDIQKSTTNGRQLIF
jgi:hypothetical protein